MDGSRHCFNQRRGIGIARKWPHADKPAVLHFSQEGAPVRMIWDKSCRTIHQHMSDEHRPVDSARRNYSLMHADDITCWPSLLPANGSSTLAKTLDELRRETMG